MASVTRIPDDLQTETLVGNKCAHCEGPAKAFCKACADSSHYVVGAQKTWYCGSECQRKHWKPSHRTKCLELRGIIHLYRGAKLIQELFYIYRELTFELAIDNIIKLGDKMDVYEWRTKAEERKHYAMARNVVSDKRNRHAIMANDCCGESVWLFWSLVRNLLYSRSDNRCQDICS